MAVKKAVADRYLSNQSRVDSPEGQTHTPLVRRCSGTARLNLRLGKWIRDMSPRQKLLHQEAHAVFNAAVIILLHQLAFLDSDISETSDIGFAVEVFEQEASLGNNFGVDCARVLKDLIYLVQKLRDQVLQVGDLSTRLPQPDNMTSLEGSLQMNPQISDPTPLDTQTGSMEENGFLYRELQAWLDDDYLQLYNDYLV